MARIFSDGAATTYDATNAKFITNDFGFTNSLTGTKNTNGAFEMYNFSTPLAFQQKADNSVAGEMRDCGECHVGGGMMEYANNTVPATDYSSAVSYDPAKRTSLRDVVFGTAVTAFNYFIDIFNPDPAMRGNAIQNDYSQSGVMEMDCLMCHLTDYSWEERKAAVREGRFDASRVAGARFGTFSANYNGRTVVYDPAAVVADADGNLKIAATAASKIEPVPPASNCAACHQTVHNVDWKKRGEVWLAEAEVHYSFGCMACHQRKDAGSPDKGISGLTSDKKLGQCDPAKGAASPFDAMWNPLDKVQFKECADCHQPATTPTYATYGAADSTSAHQAKGLTYAIAYDKSGNRVSHLDIIDCTSCHVKKTSAVTGGAFVDGTGADEEGRLAVHDNEFVERDMTNGTALHWLNGKLYSANLLTSFFWRDVNGLLPANNGLDANNDTRTAGMDALLQTHVSNINHAAGLHALTADGQVSSSEIKAQLAAFNNATYGLKAQLGISDPNNDKKFLAKLSFLGVPFKATHNIAPKMQAWGAGVNGCKECHAPNAGFYNGTYAMKGKMQFFNYSSNQVAKFTKVNGLTDPSDFHPNVVNKGGDRSVPVQLVTATAPGQTTVAATIRDIDRSEVLYEPTFLKRNTAWYDNANPIVGGVIPAVGVSGSPWYNAALGGGTAAGSTSTVGWLVKIETWDGVTYEADGVTPKIVTRTKQVSSDLLTSITDLISNLGDSFCNNSAFEFTIAKDVTEERVVITAKPGYKIRLSPQMDVGPLGLALISSSDTVAKGALWTASPIIRGANSYTGRSQWVSYLDTISEESVGLKVNPVAAINAITDVDPMKAGVQIFAGTLNLAAADAQVYNSQPVGTSTYTWRFSDGYKISDTEFLSGQTASRPVSTLGVLSITLDVVDEEGKTSVATSSVEVVAPASLSISYDNATKIAKFDGLPAASAKLKIYWGDGSYKTVTANGSAPVEVAKTYATAGVKTIKLYIYDITGIQIGYKTQTITVL